MALETASLQDRPDLALEKADLFGRGGSQPLIAIRITLSGAYAAGETGDQHGRRGETTSPTRLLRIMQNLLPNFILLLSTVS